MRQPLVSDELWAIVEPLLPPEPAKPKGGRPRVSDRAVLKGIIFVLRSGTAWALLPRELECGSGMTCWRRLRDWQAAGVWQQLHEVLLERLAHSGQLDWSRVSVDSCSIPAAKGGKQSGRVPQIAPSRAPSATSP